jgi:hypothetical protein
MTRIEAWGNDLRQAAIRYDRRLCQRERLPNIHRLGLILERIEEAQQMVANGETVRVALCHCFNDRLLAAMLKASGQAAPTVNEIRGYGAELLG